VPFFQCMSLFIHSINSRTDKFSEVLKSIAASLFFGYFAFSLIRKTLYPANSLYFLLFVFMIFSFVEKLVNLSTGMFCGLLLYYVTFLFPFVLNCLNPLLIFNLINILFAKTKQNYIL
jgi:hypothetical protein